MPRTRVKICGIRDQDMLQAAVASGADAIGLVFVEASPRYIEPAAAWELVSRMPPWVSSVGLFRDAPIDAFCDVEEICPTAMSQLHGDEAERLVRECGPGVIKAVRYDSATIEAQLKRWDALEEVDAILVDGSAGGEGVTLDWAGLRAAMDRADIGKPVILAGGLTPDNVADAIRAVRPFGVDVSSGVETAPGVKSVELIEKFCRAVAEADRG